MLAWHSPRGTGFGCLERAGKYWTESSDQGSCVSLEVLPEAVSEARGRREPCAGRWGSLGLCSHLCPPRFAPASAPRAEQVWPSVAPSDALGAPGAQGGLRAAQVALVLLLSWAPAGATEGRAQEPGDAWQPQTQRVALPRHHHLCG